MAPTFDKGAVALLLVATCLPLLGVSGKQAQSSTDEMLKQPKEEFTFKPNAGRRCVPFCTCFSGATTVETTQGRMSLADLSKLENPPNVWSVDAMGTVVETKVGLWLHASDGPMEALEIELKTGHTLTMSPDHIAYTVPCVSPHQFGRQVLFAHRVREGDCMLVRRGASTQPSVVTSIKQVNTTGRYNFVTETGSMLVNGVAASCYSRFENEKIQHLFYRAASLFAWDAERPHEENPIALVLWEMQAYF